ncbi:MAG: SPFH domain-containing protein [Planctomycetota bacterium]|jgi:uncharacterized membrane protein YqiK
MSMMVVVLGLVIAVVIVVGVTKVTANVPGAGGLRIAAGLAGLLVFLSSFAFASVRYVGEDYIGIVVKNVAARQLPEGQIIATNGEKGPQARILGPGWNFWKWPVIYDVDKVPVTEIREGEVGLITCTDGRVLPPGEIYAPEWEDTAAMLDAEFFLGEGEGYKGPQASVLNPGKYRINTRLYQVEKVPVTNIEKATVGVIKSNVGDLPDGAATDVNRLGEKGYRGIWREPYKEQKIYLNTKAYEITHVSLRRNVVRYTAAGTGGEEREIEVRSSDGFTFPVDVRIEYLIRSEDAPIVVAVLGDDLTTLREVLNSAVRAIFRNNAEGVKALDYVQQRSQQEVQSLAMLQDEMTKVGVSVMAVRIGDVGDEQTLGTLLKTQTDREIARQEQETFQEQQRAAEQRKALTRTEQEAEEERRLATARYEVQIAEQQKERRIIEAGAEAEAIRIKAEAQAEAYRVVAQQIGPGNAALVELLKIVGEQGINITPRVMVNGNGQTNGTAASAETTALIGTMLDSMLSRDVPEKDTDDQQVRRP